MSQTTINCYMAALWFVASVSTFYPILYTLWFKWWASSLGRALFTKATVLAITVDYTLASAKGWVTNIDAAIVLLFALGLAICFQILVMARVKTGRDRHWDGIAETEVGHRDAS